MNTEPSLEQKKTYKGRCHCGAIKFTVALPPLETGATSVMQCNCSICTKKGYLLVYPPASDVIFESGEDKLGLYIFGSKTRPHKFCQICGTSIMIDISKPNVEPKYAMTVWAPGLRGGHRVLTAL
jgi:hypothetical protein